MSDWLVLKPIPIGGGKKIEPNTVVQADNWRNRRTLEAGRYIQRIELTPEVKKPKVEKASPEATVVASDESSVAETPKKKAGRPPKAQVTEG